MKSMIPALIIDHMELYAHEYAQEHWEPHSATASGYPTKGLSEKKMHMSELFQLVAGTSSGSIVAAGVSYGTAGVPKLWGSDIADLFEKNGKDLFEKHSLKWGLHIFFWVSFALVFACVGYWAGKRRYDSDRYRDAFENLKMIMSNSKRQAKNKEEKFPFEDLLPIHDNDYRQGNREPLIGGKGQDGQRQKNYWKWLNPEQQRLLSKKLMPWCDVKSIFANLEE